MVIIPLNISVLNFIQHAISFVGVLSKGGASGDGPRYKPEGCGFDSSLLLEFFIDLIFSAALYPWGRLSAMNISWWVKAAGA
jgi:hypothetical protein